MSKLQLYNSNNEPVVGILTHLSKKIRKHNLSAARDRFFNNPTAQNHHRIWSQLWQTILHPNRWFHAMLPLKPTLLALSQSQILEAEGFPFMAPSDLPLKRDAQAIKSFNVILEPCADAAMNTKLQKAIPQAVNKPKKSIAYVQTSNDQTTMQNFFEADDDATTKSIFDRLTAIIRNLSFTTSGATPLLIRFRFRFRCFGHYTCVAAGLVAMNPPLEKYRWP